MERVLISCLLNNPSLLNVVSSKIKPEYFDDVFLGNIYKKMLELGAFSTPILAKELNVEFNLLFDIENMVNFADKTTVEGYGYALLEDYKARTIQKMVSSGKINFEEIENIRRLSFFDEVVNDESEQFLQVVQKKYAHEKDDRTIKTGFYELDKQIDGFRKSEAIFIGGRPGSGKTTYGMNVAYNMAMSGYKVLFCSLEMAAVELHTRLIKSITKINNYEEMSEKDFNEIIRESKRVKSEVPLFIYDKPGMLWEDIVYKATERHKKEGVDIVFIDHLAILKSTLSFRSRYEEVSYLTAQIKVLARKLDIPVVCLCQLNRALETREIKAPTLSDLRDSGSIEQDGDLIGFIYRPEYHLKDKEPDDITSQEHQKWQMEMDEVKGKAQFILSKNRRGLIGKFKLGFDGANYTFYERNN